MNKNLNEMKMYSSNLVELYKEELDILKSNDRIKNGIITIIRIEFQNKILKFITKFLHKHTNKSVMCLKFDANSELSAAFNGYLHLIASEKCTSNDLEKNWRDIIPEFNKETQDVLNLLSNHYDFKVTTSISFEEKEIDGIVVLLPNIKLVIERK